MIKFVPLVVLVAVVLGVFAYFGFFSKPQINPVVTPPVTSDISAYDMRIKTLEGAVLELADKTGNTKVVNSVSQAAPSNFDSRLNTLEVSVADLKDRVKKLEGGSASPITQTQTPSSKSPVYILSLGSGGSTTAMDWAAVSSINITIDPADYPGYTSMQLEVSLKVLSGNGKAFARLYESSSGLAVLSSEVSTSAYDYTWVSSQTFTVSSKKTYVFQLKSLTGYEASIQSARVKVNF